MSDEKPMGQVIQIDEARIRDHHAIAGTAWCAFRRSRPAIPSEAGRLYRLKPARDSDDPGHLLGLALVSALPSVHSTGSASSF